MINHSGVVINDGNNLFVDDVLVSNLSVLQLTETDTRVVEGVALTTGINSEIVDTCTVKLSVTLTGNETVNLAYDGRLEVNDASGSVISK